MTATGISIVPYDCRAHESEHLASDIDVIFFASTAMTTFAGEAERAAFRERWLGRFLTHFPSQTWLATERSGRTIGYLVGCLEDPALCARFDDIGYFKDLADLTRAFPAQLHINVLPGFRSLGIGARLIGAFAAGAAAAGTPGIHVVTGKGLRNVGFYLRQGFAELRMFPWNGRDLVFLGRSLVQPLRYR